MRSRHRWICFGLAATAAVAAGSLAAAATEPVTIASAIPYAEGSELEVVRDTVRNQCQLQEKLSESIAQNAQKMKIPVTRSSESLDGATGRVLKIEITKAIARAGGLYSGVKQVHVVGRLEKGGEVIGSFDGKRSASGGVFAQFRSTCGIVQQCVKVLGKDISKWLEQPTVGARIGELAVRNK